jgi:hypothetical protein
MRWPINVIHLQNYNACDTTPDRRCTGAVFAFAGSRTYSAPRACRRVQQVQNNILPCQKASPVLSTPLTPAPTVLVAVRLPATTATAACAQTQLLLCQQSSSASAQSNFPPVVQRELWNTSTRRPGKLCSILIIHQPASTSSDNAVSISCT